MADLHALCFDARDPVALGRFWSALLRWEQVPDREDSVAVVPTDGTAYRLRFVPSRREKVGPNRIHLDLTSEGRDQEEIVARALELGARHLDLGLGPDEHHVPMTDPEGNELCVIEPGNRFLAGCGPIGAINCEGMQEVGYFWSAALGWPLVWDQDGETAIQASSGGTKITWSGPPVPVKTGKGRLHLELAPRAEDGQRAEVERLVSLGAAPVDIGQGEVAHIVLGDPEGNEFCVLPV